jgi:hypothetical protein
MSDRFVDIGQRKWKNPSPETATKVRWKASAKGNPYADINGRVVVITKANRESKPYSYGLAPENPENNKFEFHGAFETEDEAKNAAIQALRPKRTPVPVEEPCQKPTSTKTRPKRKIVL